ncbi:SNF2 family N-terminal domain-containing protein [Calycina marina]|uniref:SNF2 family N-terminal domain-containing protein n=1 Tax=Calycina marina TaxID=1763456 RepID=A0A9P8CF36_9HELO|nr:SNF2 family N-terminal domain-containing protein [Calycina marina]
MSKKRQSDAIDLTRGSSDIENPSLSQPSHSLARASQSSQPHGSQTHESSQARDSWIVTQNLDDENEIIDLSQDAVNEGHGWVCIGAIECKIVGVRFYNGYASVNEQVLVKRENNPYDSNAIRINNLQGTQIGHLPRILASKMAPYMDSRSIVVEGIISGEKEAYDCPILLRLFSPGEPIARANLEARLKADRVPLKTQNQVAPKKLKQPVVPPKKYQAEPELTMEDLIRTAQVVRPRDIKELAETWAAGEDKLSLMPMAEQPENLRAILLPYQRQGLAWMLEKEKPILPDARSTNVCQLWKRDPARPRSFINLASGYSTVEEPKLARGGILADDMGLGKTLQMISVILEGAPGTTLIVAPLSVMSNWAQQMERHVKPEHALKVLTFHGSITKSKMWTRQEFSRYDVVITTYGMVGTEYSAAPSQKVPRAHGLFSMSWTRIVLDEGHQIRNPATRSAVAATSMLAKNKWVLTGTPIVNTIKDLYSMLKFLGITGGLEKLELFNQILTRPLSQGSPESDILLQTVMRTFCLRRKKHMKFVDLKLPELTERIHRITFRKDEKEKYAALKSEATGLADRYAAGKIKGFSGYGQVLEVLLRLRQVCCHWKLTGTLVTDLMAILEKSGVLEINNESRQALQMLLQLSVDNREECAICLEDLHDPVITACKHIFGRECIERTIELQHKCPMCRAHLESKEVLVEPAVEIEEIEDPDIDVHSKSSKTEALMSILVASRRDPLSKVVIFSQWTSFLNIIQHQLDEAGHSYARIDGTMKPAVRDESMRALEQDPDCRILLASLSVCSVGLNLVAADTVILADSWWAPAIEDQAVDRVHRLGQTRPCTVWRLVMEESIEERVLDIQAEKRKLVGKAFQEKTKRGKKKLSRMGDIMKLLA